MITHFSIKSLSESDVSLQPADPNPLPTSGNEERPAAEDDRVNSRLTTNGARPVPPAFPTKTPERASKARGRGLLLRATRWYSSQSM